MNLSKKRLDDLDCVLGLDCSKYQKNINWEQAKASGIEFAFVKITEGTTGHEDNVYNVAARVVEAKKNGIKIGYYHFARPGNVKDPKQDAFEEVENIKKHLTILPKANFPITLDVEAIDTKQQDEKYMSIFINTFLGLFDDVTILYTYRSFFNVNTNHTFGTNPLWIASYVKNPEKDLPNILLGWVNWKIWQFTDKGTIGGYSGPIDLNVMKKDYFNLY